MPSREPELYKDKIEISQIFYLFFGGAVIVGLVFVLGVMIGRRVEARGHLDRAETQTARDPLAALDRLERSDSLSFRHALTGTAAPTEVEKAIGEIEKRRAEPKAEVKAEPKPEPKPEKIEKPEVKAEPKAEIKADKPEAKPEKHDADKKSKKHDDRSDKPVTKPEAKADNKSDARAENKSDAKDSKAADAETKVRFTLQLSSFQDKSEADTFLTSMKSAGYSAYLIEADVSGKGTFYRVRLGSYRSLEAANDAKADYEKSAKKTAQVMRL
jgi:DedD protein